MLVLGATPTALEAAVLAQRMGLSVAAAAKVTVPSPRLAAACHRRLRRCGLCIAGSATGPGGHSGRRGRGGPGSRHAQPCSGGPAGSQPAQGGRSCARPARARHRPERLAALHAPAGPCIPCADPAGDRAGRGRGTGDAAPPAGAGAGGRGVVARGRPTSCPWCVRASRWHRSIRCRCAT
ncbi:hypothetical protein ACU4GD_23680 [Cupriavidus basilensis]